MYILSNYIVVGEAKRMEVNIVKIGNSKGIRIPAAMIKACNIKSKVEIEMKDNVILIRPVETPRKGWAKAFKQMHQQQDDNMLVDDSLDHEILEAWDEN